MTLGCWLGWSKIRLGRFPCRSWKLQVSGLATFNSLEEVMMRQPACSFLTHPIEFFVTSQSTLNTPGNSGNSLSVSITVIYDASGNVSALTSTTSCFVERCLTGNTSENTSSSSISSFSGSRRSSMLCYTMWERRNSFTLASCTFSNPTDLVLSMMACLELLIF